MVTIESAILGLLSVQPMTGYDIKKMFTSSISLLVRHNNQITHRSVYYTGMDGSRRRLNCGQKTFSQVYSINEKGREELRKVLLSETEVPQLIHPFLIQLAWADQLVDSEIDLLLAKYEEEIQVQVFMLQTIAQQNNIAPSGKSRDSYINPLLARTRREAILWNKIQENRIAFFQNELKWVGELRVALKDAQERNEE